MANSQFSGPVYSNNGFRIGNYYNTIPTTTNNQDGAAIAKVQGSQSVAVAVTATANTDIVIPVPTGATIHAVRVYTTTAFGASTDAQIQLGSTSGGSDFLAAGSGTTIKAAGVYAINPAPSTGTAVGLLLSYPASSTGSATGNLYLRVIQTGSTPGTGAATLLVSYTL